MPITSDILRERAKAEHGCGDPDEARDLLDLADALDAKDAEIVTLDRMISDICAELDCVHDQEVALQAVATLRARLAAAERVVEAGRIQKREWPAACLHPALLSAVAAYDALVKEAPNND